MTFTLWFLVAGALFIGLALTGALVKRLPFTSSMFYLGAGVLLGPAGIELFRVDPIDDAVLVEHLTEIAVIVSLFTAGLKLRLPFSDRRWRPPVLLALAAMALTVGAVSALGVIGLGLPLGAAVLLGAVLAPTDPVLASDVQVEHAHDRERVRFSLTGEAGFNDGTAFPFVMLGMGLLGVHEMGAWGWRWAAVDLGWAVAGGLGIGAACGTAVARLVIHLRHKHRESAGLDDFLALGLIGLSYGAALLIHAYGFLAVFAAGLALRRVERRHAEAGSPGEPRQGAEEQRGELPAQMAEAVQGFNEQLERLGEVVVVILLGGMLAATSWPRSTLWFIPLLFLLVRPAAVFISLAGSRVSPLQRLFIGWFGVRGIGSIYYLAYALAHGVPEHLGPPLVNLTLAVVTASVVVHGISVTPLMTWYGRRKSR